MIHVCLQWQELTWDLSQLVWFKYSYSRDMRFLTYDLSSIYLIFVLTLTLTTQDAYDRGNESSKVISTIIFGRFIKLAITTSLCEGPFFYFYVESSSSTFMHRLRERSCHSEYNVHGPKIYYWLIYNYVIAYSQIICTSWMPVCCYGPPIYLWIVTKCSLVTVTLTKVHVQHKSRYHYHNAEIMSVVCQVLT
jgi:hypothetical protein